MAQYGPAQTLASHLINQTLNSIAQLESLAILNSADAHMIRSKLPSPAGPFPSLNIAPIQPQSPAPSDISTSFQQMNVGPSGPYNQQSSHSLPPLPVRSRPAPQEMRVKALWDYSSPEPGDLSFRGGDIVIIDEEVNDQWWRGRVIPQGQTYPLDKGGLFPTNYVERLPQQDRSSQNYYQSPSPQPPIQPQAMIPYAQSGPPVQYGYDQKPQLPNQGGQMMMMPPQQQVQGGVVVQQEDPKKGKFGKIGGQLGNAAVTGAGFGFGSAVASNIVNAIL